MAATATAQKTKKKVGQYIWEAKTQGGEVKKGVMEAGEAAAVEARLKSLGLSPTKVRKKSILEGDLELPGIGGVTGKDILVFTRQFATMIDAGLPLVQCLDILGSQEPNPTFKKVIMQIKAKVETGSTFADALAEHPKVFDELYVQLCAAGEVGGILDNILNRLAAYREKNEALKRKVKGAMAYPITVLVVGIAVTFLLLLKVTPVFAEMFADFGQELPGPTQVILDASEWMQQYFFHVAGTLAAIVISFTISYRNEKGRRFWDKVFLHSPIFGNVLRKLAVARFTRTLGTMISSGVPILDALDVTAKTAGNRTVEDGIYHVRNKISEGRSIAQPLEETKVFPSMVVQMIGVGEATGAMDQMLNKIADFYDDEVDTAVAALTSLLEPIMMVFLGGMVGGFLIGMYLPIFTLASAIQ